MTNNYVRTHSSIILTKSKNSKLLITIMLTTTSHEQTPTTKSHTQQIRLPNNCILCRDHYRRH